MEYGSRFLTKATLERK